MALSYLIKKTDLFFAYSFPALRFNLGPKDSGPIYIRLSIVQNLISISQGQSMKNIITFLIVVALENYFVFQVSCL